MFKNTSIILLIALAIYLKIDHVKSVSIVSGVSWIFRGTAQENNTVLTFNLYDTLNLLCKATVNQAAARGIFAITKGNTPTGMSYSSGVLSISNLGTLVYSDVDGVLPGFENFVVLSSPYNPTTATSLLYDYRYVNVGTLRTSDSATYYCSTYYNPFVSFNPTTPGTVPTVTVTATATASTATTAYSPPAISSTSAPVVLKYFNTSGGLTILVNTKAGQAKSSRARGKNCMTYSAAILAASKFLF